ncbi:unnamed protein product [Closterium sp. NIES-54]
MRPGFEALHNTHMMLYHQPAHSSRFQGSDTAAATSFLSSNPLAHAAQQQQQVEWRPQVAAGGSSSGNRWQQVAAAISN